MCVECMRGECGRRSAPLLGLRIGPGPVSGVGGDTGEMWWVIGGTIGPPAYELMWDDIGRSVGGSEC